MESAKLSFPSFHRALQQNARCLHIRYQYVQAINAAKLLQSKCMPQRLSVPAESVCVGRYIPVCTTASYSHTQPPAHSATSTRTDALPYSTIPKKKNIPIVSNLHALYMIGRGDLHHMVAADRRKLGDIYRVSVGPRETVYLHDPQAVEELFRQDEKSKVQKLRTVLPWKDWKDDNGIPHGLGTTNNAEWRRMRTVLNKAIARPSTIAQYTQDVGEVAEDFVMRLAQLQDKQQDGGILVKDELFKWVFESIGCVMFERRLGYISDNPDDEIAQFARSAHTIFSSMTRIALLPKNLAPIIRPYHHKIHDRSWHNMYTIGIKLLDGQLQHIERRLSRGEEVGGFLAGLVANPNITTDEIYSNVIDMFMGAAQTTTSTMQWILYQLAESTQCTSRLQEEVVSVAGTAGTPTAAQLNQSKYLKAFVKEVLRMHVPVLAITRITSDDMIVKGYHIPAGTCFLIPVHTMGNSSALFPEAEVFRPERWLGSEKDDIHKFSSLPFSHGPRNCIGRRLAELQLHLLTAKIIQNFDVSVVGRKRSTKFDGMLLPYPALEIKFNRRVSHNVSL